MPDTNHRSFWERLRSRRRSRGQSLVEFALVLPIMLVVFAGVVDLGRLFYAYIAVENAAKEGALYGARYPFCATETPSCGNPNNAEWRITQEAPNIAFNTIATWCVGPLTPPNSPTSTCKEGDTYVAAVSHDFRLITPILGQIFGSGLTLTSESRSTVINTAYDPTAGATASLTVSWTPNTDPADCIEIGGGSCFARSPRANSAEELRTLTVTSPTTLDFNVRVTNTSGKPLTGAAVTIREGSLVLTTGCSFPTSLPIGYDSGVCAFSDPVSWTGSAAPTEFTATVTANEQAASSDGAQVIVLEPARVALSLQVSPYRTGGEGNMPWNPTPLGSASNLTVATRTDSPAGDPPTVWYFLRVQNVSSVTATLNSFSLQETPPSGAATSLVTSCTVPFGAEFFFPRDLAPSTAIDCFFQASRSVSGDTVVTADVGLAAGTVRASWQNESTVTVSAVASCNGNNDRQVPMLVDKVAGAVSGTTTRWRVSEAQNRWTGAGFGAAAYSPTSGSDDDRVLTQSLQAFSCQKKDADVTVTHAP